MVYVKFLPESITSETCTLFVYAMYPMTENTAKPAYSEVKKLTKLIAMASLKE